MDLDECSRSKEKAGKIGEKKKKNGRKDHSNHEAARLPENQSDIMYRNGVSLSPLKSRSWLLLSDYYYLFVDFLLIDVQQNDD